MLLLVLGIALGSAAGLAPTALGADRVYWTNIAGVRVADLDGTGTPADLFADGGAPQGVALDPAAGKIYWASLLDGTIRVANLDGSGSPSGLFSVLAPRGVAIDPAAGKIYWADQGTGAPGTAAVWVANLDGSGSPSSLFTGESGSLRGVAIDPAAGKIYWADATSQAIRVGNLDGSGSPSNLFTGESGQPRGVAIDPAAGKIYWAGFNDGAIRVANLNGTGSPTNLFTGENFPLGVAIDPAAGKIYWTDSASSTNHAGTIRVANLSGTGSPVSLFTGETDPRYLAVLRAPSGTSAPTVSGGGKAGQQLSCTEGGWAGDLLGAFLYRAPASFAYQWQRDGSDIAGADQQTYTPTAAGSYTCRVTAANEAGQSSQTSSPFVVSKASPTLATSASPAAFVIGASVHDTATLSGGSNPGGQITFSVYGPDDAGCSRTPALSDTHGVSGDGQYQSAEFTPTAPGTYRYIASYSGDSNNGGASTACNDSGESVTVTAPAVSRLHLAPTSFVADSKPTPLGPPTPKRGPLGTEIRFKLSSAALVHFSIRHRPRRPKPSGPKVPHAFNRKISAGKHSVGCTGTLAHHTLHPGNYVLYARAIDTATGYRSPKVSAKFTVLPG